MKKQRIVVICPGRGSYTKETLGYLKPHRQALAPFLNQMDELRAQINEPSLSELDNAEVFSPSLHTRGEHASALIYACAHADFQSIDRERFEVVAITGNSMGWYLTLAFANSLAPKNAFSVIQTMGSMMKQKIIGGQVIYPIRDAEWKKSSEIERTVQLALQKAQESGAVYISIELGGYLVFGGDSSGLAALMKALPKVENYPFQLINHAAFHTPLLEETSQAAFELLGPELFSQPTIPMIDGRGKIWTPHNTDTEELYQYTLGHQVVQLYHFSKAVTVTLKEFAPDKVFLLGPGNSLGGAIGQILVDTKWLGLNSKQDFVEMQKKDPFLISMGLKPQN